MNGISMVAYKGVGLMNVVPLDRKQVAVDISEGGVV
jgi:hypothetical protein